MDRILFKAFGVFCFVGAFFAAYAAVTLTWPGTFLDGLWAVNPAGHQGLSTLGRGIGFPFLFLSMLMLTMGVGWMRRRKFAWYLAVVTIPLNMIGDLVRALAGQWAEGLLGLVLGVWCFCIFSAHP